MTCGRSPAAENARIHLGSYCISLIQEESLLEPVSRPLCELRFSVINEACPVVGEWLFPTISSRLKSLDRGEGKKGGKTPKAPIASAISTTVVDLCSDHLMARPHCRVCIISFRVSRQGKDPYETLGKVQLTGKVFLAGVNHLLSAHFQF